MSAEAKTTGLIFTGGGARAAYQVGVLKALADLLPPSAPCPFPIITGTSAGAVAAAVLASRAGNFRAAVMGLEQVWANFHVSQVFRADTVSMLRSGLHWLFAAISGGLLLPPPKSLFDNAPLRALIERTVSFRGIRRSVAKGRIQALGITATGFGSGRCTTFFEAAATVHEWTRISRSGERTHLTLDHVMASLSIPFLFPAVKIDEEYWGDGSMRQATPLSSAIHLGADRILVIGVREQGFRAPFGSMAATRSPTSGQIFGYMLDTLFMDQIYADLERLQRFNQFVKTAPATFSTLRPVEPLVLAPSRDLRELAAPHMATLPRALRMFLRMLGAQSATASSLASYLMFEKNFTRELIALGRADAMARSEELLEFIGGVPVAERVESA